MKKVLKLIPFLLTVMLFCSMSLTAFAMEELPDPDRKGSVSVIVRNTENKQPVSGGSLTLYKVADVKVDDWNFSFAFTNAFSGCDLELNDIQSEDLAEKLAAYAADQKLSGMSAGVGSDGKAVFSDLELGLYLVTQLTPAEGYSCLNPFLVTVPLRDGESLIYDVEASPKAGTVVKREDPDPTPDKPEPENPKTQESALEVTPVKPLPEKNDPLPVIPGGDIPSVTETDGIIPQTGQLWWPVPFLAAVGMIFVAIGWMKRKDAEK